MKFNKQELRKAAEKATEGNYVVGHCDINKHGNLSSVYVCQEWNGMAGGVVAECHVNCLTKNSDQVYANAGFMALASPANVISLLEEISTLESRCAELAAENAWLKAVCEDRRTFIMNGVQLGYIQVLTVETDPALETIRIAVSPQEPTQATDAFLAEIERIDRAAGIGKGE
ncbi:TPA: ead/Ea22-like family protein [Escherichia coli]|nr:ead/Ea22-like family protein [Escherichia coli]